MTGVCGAVAAPLMLSADRAEFQLAPLYRGVGGLVVVGTAMTIGLVLRAHERRHRTPDTFAAVYWCLGMLALLGSQLLWSGLIRALAPASVGVHLGLGSLLFDSVVVLTALAMAALAGTGRRMPSPGALTCALVAAGLVGRVAAYALPFPRPSDPVVVGLAVMTLAAYALVAALVTRTFRLSRGSRSRLWALLLATGTAVAVRGEEAALPLVTPLAAVVFAVAAVTWSLGMYLEYFADSQAAPADEGDLYELDDTTDVAPREGYEAVALEIVDRAERERLHEVRSTVAGIRAAADLSDNDAVDEQARLRLRQSMRSELEWLARLVSEAAPEAGDAAQHVELDEALSAVTDTHRARGHDVEWTPSGSRVLARPDDVRAALNILLENTAVHASGASSRIEVREDERTVEIRVSDDGPGIAPHARDDVFSWGVSGDNRGHGIGLSMAQRLLAEQGGSLSLVEAPGQGATFAIRLPAVRVPAQRRDGSCRA